MFIGNFYSYHFLAYVRDFSLCPEILQYAPRDSASPQEFFNVRDAGLEPGTTASVVWSAANEPTHLGNFFASYPPQGPVAV